MSKINYDDVETKERYIRDCLAPFLKRWCYTLDICHLSPSSRRRSDSTHSRDWSSQVDKNEIA